MAVVSHECFDHGRRYKVDCKRCIVAQAECPAHQRARNDCRDCCEASRIRIALRVKRIESRAAASREAERRRVKRIEERVRRDYDRELLGSLRSRRRLAPPDSREERARKKQHDNGLAKLNPFVRW